MLAQSLILFVCLSAVPDPLCNDGRFIRGDYNGDGNVEQVDAILILQCAFQGNCGISCESESRDSNDDGRILEMADATYILLYAFSGGDQPPEPFEEIGIDPTPDNYENLHSPHLVYDAIGNPIEVTLDRVYGRPNTSAASLRAGFGMDNGHSGCNRWDFHSIFSYLVPFQEDIYMISVDDNISPCNDTHHCATTRELSFAFDNAPSFSNRELIDGKKRVKVMMWHPWTQISLDGLGSGGESCAVFGDNFFDIYSGKTSGEGAGSRGPIFKALFFNKTQSTLSRYVTLVINPGVVGLKGVLSGWRFGSFDYILGNELSYPRHTLVWEIDSAADTPSPDAFGFSTTPGPDDQIILFSLSVEHSTSFVRNNLPGNDDATYFEFLSAVMTVCYDVEEAPDGKRLPLWQGSNFSWQLSEPK